MAHTAVDGGSKNTYLPQMSHLVFHQRNQGSDDNTHTILCHGRHLEGNGLATTCRHQSQRVFAGTDALDDFPLNTAEVRITPIMAEDGYVVYHSSSAGRISSI